MKKAVSILCVAALVVSLFALAACGSKKPGEIPADSPYIGTWEATKTSVMGDDTPIEEVLGEDSYPYIIVLEPDGTSDITAGAEHNTGVWEVTANGLNMRIDGAKKDQKFTANGDTITSKIVGVEITFEKKAG